MKEIILLYKQVFHEIFYIILPQQIKELLAILAPIVFVLMFIPFFTWLFSLFISFMPALFLACFVFIVYAVNILWLRHNGKL